MNLKIPRGSTYHKITEEIKDLYFSIFSDLNNQKIINQFEEKFATYNGSKYSVTFPFARTAFHYAIRSLNIERNSEVIMSPITIKPILDVVILNGLKPVFVDLNKNDLSYDVVDLKKKITPNTKLILITYLFGIVPNLSKFNKDEFKINNLKIIEDFSQCLNGKYEGKKTGNFSDISIYSCSSIKTLDTYGGGVAFTNNKDNFKLLKEFQKDLKSPKRFFLVKKILINLVRTVLTNLTIFNFLTYYILRFINIFSKNTKMLGERDKRPIKNLPVSWFQKYTSFQAQKGIQSLQNIEISDNIRKKFSEKYIKGLKNFFNFPLGFDKSQNIYWQFLVYVKDPNELKNKLLKKGIDTSSTSLEKLNKLSKYGFNFQLHNVDEIYNNSLFLPCFSKLKEKHIDKIIYEITKIKEQQ